MNDRRSATLQTSVAIVVGAVLAVWGPALLSLGDGSPPVGPCSPPVAVPVDSPGPYSPPIEDFSPPVGDCSPPQTQLISYVSAWPQSFSPNGDQCLDSARITVGFNWPALEDADSVWWDVEILGPRGPLHRLAGSAPRYSLEFDWAGTSMDGTPAPEGSYRIEARAWMYDASLGQGISDAASGRVSIDVTPPTPSALQPGRSDVRASAEVPGGTRVEAVVPLTVSTQAEVRATYAEPLSWYLPPSLSVSAIVGTPAYGYTYYEWWTSSVVFWAQRPGLIGTYRAVATATDAACNTGTTAWEFTAAAPVLY